MSRPRRVALVVSSSLFLLLASFPTMAAEGQAERVSCLGLEGCLSLSNGTVEVVVTTDVGPRIARYGFVGQENLLAEMPDHRAPASTWKVWGGHRLWAAPEARPRTYAPDNVPVEVHADDWTLRLLAPVEPSTSIQKQLEVRLDRQGTSLVVVHRITNRSPWPIELATWGLSVMSTEGGGTVVVPQEPFRPHGQALLPARPMILWPYTDLTDPRLTLGKRYVRISPDPSLATSQKIGFGDRQGWVAYALGRTLLLKRFDHDDHATYPDFGSNLEIFTSRGYLEIETLGPLSHLDPGESAQHTERWSLHRDVTVGDSEESLEAALAPLLAETPAGKAP